MQNEAPSYRAFGNFRRASRWAARTLLLVFVGATGEPAVAQWEVDHWPSNGPPGTLTAPWKATNPDSTNPLKLGIADAPVNAFTAATLPDGRAAAVFEWIRAEGGKPRIFLHVRTLGERGWADAVPPLKLGDSEAVTRNWKEVKFLMGSVIFSQLEARALTDGRLRIVGVELRGERKGDERVVRVWDVKDGKWDDGATWTLTLPGDRPGNIAEDVTIGPGGEVYWSGLRTCWREPNADTPKDHAAIMKSPAHPHSGKLRFESLIVRRYEPATGKAVIMDYEAAPSPIHGTAAVSTAGFWHAENLPIASVFGLPPGETPKREFVSTVLQWRDGRWQPLAVPSDLGLPAGQRPDGMPVWVTKPQSISTDGSYRPATMKFTPGQFVELDDQLKPRRQALPENYAFTMFEAPWVRYVDGQPLVSVMGHYRAGKDTAFLVGLAARDNNGKWMWLGSRTVPPYWRPAHGGHDGIGKQRWAVGTDQVLLLWQSSMPIHGPRTVSGAWAPRAVIPATQPATRKPLAK